MKICEKYTQHRPVLSFEIFPPKKAQALQNIDETIKILCGQEPDYISVTFGAGGSSNNNKTIELATKIKRDYQIEPMVHLTCLCYGKNEIDEFYQILKDNQINNVLALRGDHNPQLPEREDFKHADELTAYLKSKGKDFCVAGACYPEVHPEAKDGIADIHNLKRKVEAGADFLVSQLFFDNDHFYSFQEKCAIAGINVPISAGIMPVTNKAQIERMVHMCGAHLPEKFIKIMNKYEDNPTALFDAGLAYAISQVIDLIANDVDGIHLYTMNNPAVAKRICEGIQELIVR